MNAPDGLTIGDGRQFFQLQLHHRERLGKVALRKMNHAEENRFGRQPRDIQARLPELMPVFLRDVLREGFTGRGGHFALQRDIALCAELPEMTVIADASQDIA